MCYLTSCSWTILGNCKRNRWQNVDICWRRKGRLSTDIIRDRTLGAWNMVSTQIIMKGVLKTWITNALNGSEDDILRANMWMRKRTVNRRQRAAPRPTMSKITFMKVPSIILSNK
jgi:hypothetical protein